jgi:hypothetical protein
MFPYRSETIEVPIDVLVGQRVSVDPAHLHYRSLVTNSYAFLAPVIDQSLPQTRRWPPIEVNLSA